MLKKKIIVTGATGFIGAKLTERLVAMGIKPHILIRKNSDLKRLSSFIDKITIHELELVDFDNVRILIKEVKPQVVFHLAGLGVYSYGDASLQNINFMIDSNIRGTLHLLQACKPIDLEIFINTGSCFEYGESKYPFKENSMLTPANVYGATKIFSTLLSQTFYKNDNIPVVTLRPFTAYGPMEDERRFISTVIRKCLRGENPELTAETIVRDFVYIDDIVDGYLLASENRRKIHGEIINISTGIGTKLFDVANLIIAITKAKNLKPQVGVFPTKSGEVFSLVGDPQKAKKLLGWKAKYSIEEGIKNTMEWILKSNSFS